MSPPHHSAISAPLERLGAVADIHLLLKLDLVLAGRGLAAVPFLHQDFVVEAALGFERARAALRIVNVGIARAAEQAAAQIDLRAVGLAVGLDLEAKVGRGLLEQQRLHLRAPVEPVVIRARRLDALGETLVQHPFRHVGRDAEQAGISVASIAPGTTGSNRSGRGSVARGSCLRSSR
jgi:hypothetical protein